MSDKDKLCGITFDAISIKTGLYYEKNTDRIVGFEDCGEYYRGEKPAQYAMVFMGKGLCMKWKHALGSLPANTIKTMIQDYANKLLACGFHPKFVVCDQDSSNRSAFCKLNITAASPYMEIQDNGNCTDDVTPLLSALTYYKEKIKDSEASHSSNGVNQVNSCDNDFNLQTTEGTDYDHSDIRAFLQKFDYDAEPLEDPSVSVASDHSYEKFDDTLHSQDLSQTSPIDEFIHNFDYNLETIDDLSPPTDLANFIQNFDNTVESDEQHYSSHESRCYKDESPGAEVIEDNVISYVAGYCCHRILKNHNCKRCRSQLIKHPQEMQEIEQREIYLSQKGNGDKVRLLSYPMDTVFDIVKAYEKIFQQKIKSLIHTNGIKQKLNSFLSEVCLNKLSVCQEVHTLLKNSFLNMRLYYYTKFYNKSLRRKRKFTPDAAPARKCRKIITVTHM
ncbi:hypothetical protein E2C01_056463 [Portunus trituberculatus]|uniref:Transposable element P transposase-like RNase H domain-containing protein n=1 Tax=Portunus trituberculatus TaxID=210409 RepID=A0A5B7GZP2_PORTR|nr:hypothetical protein [Portunus trituberculatus]